jgi:hypothetical protein
LVDTRFIYDSVFNTKDYHIISGKEGVEKYNLQIIPNKNRYKDQQFSSVMNHAPSIGKFASRKPITHNRSINDNRFE